MKKYWFRVHKFWGWYPVSWKAWSLIAAMVISTAGIFLYVDQNSHSIGETLLGAFPTISLIITSTIFVALEKGEKPKFGKHNSKKENYSPDNPRVYIILPILSFFAGFCYLSLGDRFGSGILLIETVILAIIFQELLLLAKDE